MTYTTYMQEIYLTNTRTHKKEKFVPVKAPFVKIYSCGPTVYWNQHIGHMYAYVQWDTLVRFLRSIGYEVKWVMNITDVGHMTSDEDTGEDKMEKGAKREGLSVWDIADKYIKQFLQSMDLLNIQRPDILCRATEHIDEQISLIKKIEENGFTYKTATGLIFDTKKFPEYPEFARLNLKRQHAGSRVDVDPGKKQPWDFLLWVTNQPEHIMKWKSPWGEGFPGWHIECTAMSVKYLGEVFDIHTGGKEHIPVHHTNEVAQAYGAFGRQTANYWLHNDWLTLDGKKISKSLGNSILVTDLVDKGFDPLALRYLILTSHYRSGLNFTLKGLSAAQVALNNLREQVKAAKTQAGRTYLSEEKNGKTEDFSKRFLAALSDDLNTPTALAVLWEAIKSNIPSEDKYDLAISFDEVLGLGLSKLNIITEEKFKLHESKSSVVNLTGMPLGNSTIVRLDNRELARIKGDFVKADKLRNEIKEKDSLIIRDTSAGMIVETLK